MCKCKICGFETKSHRGLQRHEMACRKYELLKDNIINDYNSGDSIFLISERYKLGESMLSDRLSRWGVEKRGENSDRYKYRGLKSELNEDYFSNMDAPQYWMLGMFASDGCVSGKNGNHFFISQSGDDGRRRIEYIRDQLDLRYDIRTCEKKKGMPAHSISFSSDKIRDTFKKYNIVRNKTRYYTFPNDIPAEYLSSFIAGYVEGDGCVGVYSSNGGRKHLVASFVGTKQFIEKCYEMIPIKGHVRKKHSMTDIYEIRWNCEHAVHFCDWMYTDDSLYHSYKYDNYIRGKKLLENSRRFIVRRVKEQMISDFNSGKYKTAKECAIAYKKNETLVYNWFKEWLRDGVIVRDYHLKN